LTTEEGNAIIVMEMAKRWTDTAVLANLASQVARPEEGLEIPQIAHWRNSEIGEHSF
jgi:hypothetical protein